MLCLHYFQHQPSPIIKIEQYIKAALQITKDAKQVRRSYKDPVMASYSSDRQVNLHSVEVLTFPQNVSNFLKGRTFRTIQILGRRSVLTTSLRELITQLKACTHKHTCIIPSKWSRLPRLANPRNQDVYRPPPGLSALEQIQVINITSNFDSV